MKKILLSLAVAAFAMSALAQVVNVASVKKVALPAGMSVDKAVISPQGDFVVVSDNAVAGLKKIDLATGKSMVISKTASNYDVKISNDGGLILFREYSVDQNHLRWATIKTFSPSAMKESTIVAKSRDIQGTALDGGTVRVVDNGRMKSQRLYASAIKSAPVPFIDHGKLKLSVDGTTRNLSPQGTAGQSYLWPSISPNGKNVLYYLVGEGTFICDLNGKNVRAMGNLRAARWIDDSTIVGMRDEDNGVNITKSEIIAKSVANLREQKLSPAGMVAVYPSAGYKKIAFSTLNGELYLVTLK